MLVRFHNIQQDNPDFVGHIDKAYEQYRGKEMQIVVLDSDRKIVAVWVEKK